MKPQILSTIAVIASLATASSAFSATTLNTGAAFNFNAGNWNNGAPSPVNPGTISANYTAAGAAALANTTVTQTAGIGTGLEFNYYHPTFTFNLEGGTINLTSDFLANTGVFNVSGGSINTTRFRPVNGGTFNVSGGTHTLSSSTIFSNSGALGQVNLTGGTFRAATATSMFSGNNVTTTIGIGDAVINASLVTAFGGAAANMNFLTGWTGELNFSAATNWSTELMSSGAKLDGVDIDGTNIHKFFISGGKISLIPKPEIAVEQPLGTNIPTNGTKDFRWVAVGSHSDLVFTIKNTDTADLTGLTITKDGANAADFTVTSAPTAPVAGPDGSTTFTVRFAPAAPGVRSAAIHIANNDSGENPFHINLTGIGTTSADPTSGALRIFLLAGQSNMEGQAYAFDSATTASWNVPTMQFLVSGTAAATNYLANMPFGFKTSLNPDWLLPRNDAWAVHYNSSTGTVKEVLPTNDPADILSGIQLLSPGFGAGASNGSMIGPELAMGIRLADATGDPVFLFKSSMGGTTLGNDWRPPAAVAARGGSVGANYTNTVNRFREFLDTLDADLADDGKLNGYHNATSYKVSGVVWFQGWNEMFDDPPYTAAQLQAEYKDNLKDLVHSLRAADPRMPANLPLIIPESADQNANLNAGRVAAVAELNAEVANTAVYIENNEMIDTFWGNNELGVPFSTVWGYHFNARAENYLEIGWRIGGAALANGYISSSNSATVAQALTGPGGPFVGQTDPDVVGFAANPDGDRWVNALEVLLGFNAALPDGAMPMTTSFATDGANTWLEVHVTVDAAMDDLMTWRLEFSSDLLNWAESSNPRTLAGQSGSLRTIAIRDDQPAGTTPGRFYRIKLLAGE